MSKCKTCNTDYYISGDGLEPDEPCWCREMNSEQAFYDWKSFRIHILLKISMFFHNVGELFVPKELKG